MLRTRLIVGSVLTALAVGVLVIDGLWLAPWYPFLFAVLLGLGLAACHELLQMLPAERRPPGWLCYLGVALLAVANWPAHVPPTQALAPDPWHWVVGTFTAVVVSAFLVEMARFREPGESVTRIALAVWVASYVGLLPCFFAQLRWLPEGSRALALAIFVPKGCDIGAYFTGRFLGRHKMTPVLSPKKTWEGFAGGLAVAVLTAVLIQRLGEPVLRGGDPAAVGFGLTVGVAGVLGDLAESLVKRDGRQKDASQAVPGFGGVLDVVDAVVFAAPAAYVWLRYGGT
jgi:phosphatidate cytidylyltransferase